MFHVQTCDLVLRDQIILTPILPNTLTGFDCMATYLGLSYAKKLKNYNFYVVFLYTVIWYQVFLFDTNNLHIVIWFQVFLILWFIHNYMISSNYFCLIIVICLHTVIWLQVTYNDPL